ncbi:MAG: D-alanyl-D-alanine carboxypeptidase/D-alanyl-D-alanine-endopeptidase, partial [Bacteroidetes bacterium HGW-Bacteroidetes-6]
HVIIFLFTAFAGLISLAQNVQLKQSINDLRNDPYMKQGRWGCVVVNCTSGNIVEEFNADSLFIPASIMKLWSTSTALEVLSDTFRFSTKVYTTGTVDAQGILHGDLWIEGGADPTIGSDYFGEERFIDSLYNALVNAGVSSIDGNIYGLANIFDSLIIPDTYPDDDYGNYYGAGTSGLIWDGNRMTLVFKTPSAFGALTTLASFFPQFDNFVLENQATAGRSGTGDNSIVYGKPFDFNRKIEGTLPPAKAEFKVYGSSPDPALGFVIAVKYKLEKRGVFTSGKCIGKYSGTIPVSAESPVLVYYSVPMSDIVKFTNTHSHNVTAETLLKAAGLKFAGRGSYAAGLQALEALLDNLNVDRTMLILNDGSGLSKTDQLSPRAMGTFLKEVRQKPWFGTLYSSLPIAGKTGTLSTMFKGTAVEGKLRAKSGYMKTVRSYAGYVNNAQGDTMAFCVMVNNYSGNAFALKKKLENFMIAVSQSE